MTAGMKKNEPRVSSRWGMIIRRAYEMMNLELGYFYYDIIDTFERIMFE